QVSKLKKTAVGGFRLTAEGYNPIKYRLLKGGEPPPAPPQGDIFNTDNDAPPATSAPLARTEEGRAADQQTEAADAPHPNEARGGRRPTGEESLGRRREIADMRGAVYVATPTKERGAAAETEGARFEQVKNPARKSQFLQIVAKPDGRKSEPKLTRVAFKVSRLMEFCSERELQNQTGHAISDWPLVVGKECIDNALDACEEA